MRIARPRNKTAGVSFSCSQDEKDIWLDLVKKSGHKTGSGLFVALIREISQPQETNLFPKIDSSDRVKNLLKNFKEGKKMYLTNLISDNLILFFSFIILLFLVGYHVYNRSTKAPFVRIINEDEEIEHVLNAIRLNFGSIAANRIIEDAKIEYLLLDESKFLSSILWNHYHKNMDQLAEIKSVKNKVNCLFV